MQSVLAKKTPIQVAYVVREPFRWQRVHLSRLFFRCDATTRAMTLLHECAHVANDALDHAYLYKQVNSRRRSIRVEGPPAREVSRSRADSTSRASRGPD